MNPTKANEPASECCSVEKEMKIIPNSLPSRRLLSTISTDDFPPVSLPQEAASPFVLKGASIWSGNGRSIFCGIVLGAILLFAVAHLFNNHERAVGKDPISFKTFIHARTHTVSASAHELVSPAPIIVQINSKLIHVSAIALGHPRLAVINSQTVAEGDYVKIRSENPAVTASLRVVRIADQRIDLSDGHQTITTQLEIPALEHRKAQ